MTAVHLGASGDLAPPRQSLPSVDRRRRWYYKGKRCEAISVLDEFGWEPVKLKTRRTGSAQWYPVYECQRVCHTQSLPSFQESRPHCRHLLEAFDGRIDPFMDCIPINASA